MVGFIRLFEHGEGGVRLAQRLGDAHRDAVADPAHAAFAQRHVAAAHRDHRVRLELEHQRVADLEIHHPAQRQLGLVEHRIDGDLGLPDLGGEMAFPDRIAAELLAHEHLEQNAADRLDRRVGQQQLDLAAAVFHVDAQPHQDRGVGGPRDRGKARIGLQPVDVELHRRQRLEGELGVGQHHLDHALDQVGLDRGVGPALDADRGLAAAAAEQHVDDRIDQAGVDGHQPEIVPLLGLEHARGWPAAGSS